MMWLSILADITLKRSLLFISTAIHIRFISADVSNVIKDISDIIESEYVTHSAGIEWKLNFSDFYSVFLTINDYKMNNILNNQRQYELLSGSTESQDRIKINAQIQCSRYICNYIIENIIKLILKSLNQIMWA